MSVFAANTSDSDAHIAMQVPNWKLGQEAGRKLTQSARQMALTRLESGVIDATAPPVLSKLYLVLLA